MKLSLSWIFDHLEGSWLDLDVKELVKKFNTTTAEIEQVDHCIVETAHFFIGTVLSVDKEKLKLFCSELNKEFALTMRPDAKVGVNFMIFVHKNDVRWAALADWHAAKEGLIGALSVDQKELEGGWKKTFEAEDYILHVDNKSVTHRPDLWGHRGIAREVGAILGIAMRPEADLMKHFPLERHASFAAANPERVFSVEIKNPELVKTLAGGPISSIDYSPSFLWMAHRLARIDSRPIDAIVDTTNYVMFDVGQPMHAFDAAQISSKKIEAGLATREQTLELLDGQQVTVLPEDLVISDGKQSLGLAGVMGGASSAVSATTCSLFIEAGCFNAGAVRKTALRVKKRSEASARFEKSLDAHNPLKALSRFLTILEKNKVAYKLSGKLVLLGHEPVEQQLIVRHDLITQLLGVSIETSIIEKIVKALGFGVTKKGEEYHLTVPTYRSSKEPFIKEDIVEEVGRFFGYNKIPLAMPALSLKPSNLNPVFFERNIKNYCAYAINAHEVINYAIFDEEFLKQIEWQPAEKIAIQNPVSQHWQHLVTSLVPHLLKNVHQNKTEQEMRFFEYNVVWDKDHNQLTERKKLAGIVFNKNGVDFYQLKDQICQMLAMLGVSVSWKKQETVAPWMHPYQTAQIESQGAVLGYAGMAHRAFIEKVADGEAFIFELDAQELMEKATEEQRFTPLSKYPSTWFDISMLVPRSVTVDEIKELIMKSDARIYKVELIDFYEKQEWQDQRSVTIRFFAKDEQKTLTQAEIDHMYDYVLLNLKNKGAAIR